MSVLVWSLLFKGIIIGGHHPLHGWQELGSRSWTVYKGGAELWAAAWPWRSSLAPESPEGLWIAVTIEGRAELVCGYQVDGANGSVICTEEVVGADDPLDPCLGSAKKADNNFETSALPRRGEANAVRSHCRRLTPVQWLWGEDCHRPFCEGWQLDMQVASHWVDCKGMMYCACKSNGRHA